MTTQQLFFYLRRNGRPVGCMAFRYSQQPDEPSGAIYIGLSILNENIGISNKFNKKTLREIAIGRCEKWSEQSRMCMYYWLGHFNGMLTWKDILGSNRLEPLIANKLAELTEENHHACDNLILDLLTFNRKPVQQQV